MWATLAGDARQLLLLLLLVVHLLSLAHESLNVRLFIEVVSDEILSESFVEDQTVVILIEALRVHTHECEELGVDHFLSLQDSHLVGEDLAQVCRHFFWLFIQREQHLRLQIEHVLLLL